MTVVAVCRGGSRSGGGSECGGRTEHKGILRNLRDISDMIRPLS